MSTLRHFRYWTPERQLGELLFRGFWFGVGGACVGAVALLAGMAIGARDARVTQMADRAEAAARCADDGLALLVMRDPARPGDDRWICTSGSGRLLREARR